MVNRLAIGRLNHQYRECDTLGVPLKDLKPMTGGPKGPGKAFWMVLIVIGGVTVWQKVGAPLEPVVEASPAATLDSQ